MSKLFEQKEQKPMSCIDCAHHAIINDADPNDWFNDDDCAVVCTKVPNDEKKPDSKYKSDHSDFKVVSCALRPYEVNRTQAPKWCPLIK